MTPPKSPGNDGPSEAEAFNEAIRAEIRAEMGRQRKTQNDLAAALKIAPGTAGSRLNGPGRPFDTGEIFEVAQWLGVRPESFYPRADVSAVSA